MMAKVKHAGVGAWINKLTAEIHHFLWKNNVIIESYCVHGITGLYICILDFKALG